MDAYQVLRSSRIGAEAQAVAHTRCEVIGKKQVGNLCPEISVSTLAFRVNVLAYYPTNCRQRDYSVTELLSEDASIQQNQNRQYLANRR